MSKKPQKHPRDMTSDELIRHVFPKPVVEHLKKVAADATAKAEKRTPKTIKEKDN